MAAIPPAAAGASSAIPGNGSRDEQRPRENTDEPDGLRHRQHGEHGQAPRRKSAEEVADAPAESAGQRQDGAIREGR